MLADQYKHEGETVAIISNGPELAEAMRAAWILKEELGIETRVVNVHTVKPFDEEAIVRAARECRVLVTAEEHQVGGLGNLVASAIMKAGVDTPPVFDMIGIEDTFGKSGQPWELLRAFGLTAEHLAARVREIAD